MGPTPALPTGEVVLESCAHHRLPLTTGSDLIALALLKLACCAEYSVVGETFGVSKTTVHRCVYAVCTAIKEKKININ